uniref:K Homology domain-containing protein n=1 Tax=Romanomermis culicivorax TaxID=13658 RepID=A0A915JF22_ROMCU
MSHRKSESSSSSSSVLTDNNVPSFERCDDVGGLGSTTTEPEDLSPPSNNRCTQHHQQQRPVQSRSATPKYLLELQNDRWILQTVMQGVSAPFFQHASRLLESEIARVENKLGRELVMTVLSDGNDHHHRSAESTIAKCYFSATDDRTDTDLVDADPCSSSALLYQSLLINEESNSLPSSLKQDSATAPRASDGDFDILSSSPDDLIMGKARVSDNAQAVLTLEEKVMLPVSDNPEYNFIGRLMGPRGMTIKRLEQETGCRLLVRGRGSIKNAAREETLRRKPGFEHLNENLHILIQAKDTADNVREKLKCGVDAVQAILKPVDNDELKQKQMRELAIINGTYRPVQNHHRLPVLQPPLPVLKPWSLLTSPTGSGRQQQQQKSKTFFCEDAILNML